MSHFDLWDNTSISIMGKCLLFLKMSDIQQFNKATLMMSSVNSPVVVWWSSHSSSSKADVLLAAFVFLFFHDNEEVSLKMVSHLQKVVILKALSSVPCVSGVSLLLFGLTVTSDAITFHTYADDTQLYLQILQNAHVLDTQPPEVSSRHYCKWWMAPIKLHHKILIPFSNHLKL